ncbi:hypothetical protein KFK09_010439 [Dendrobium nobile]|uniref:Uncharacterized protein n=1 Tax=Dendrobium nobile TaxID=94219 RepID=A0A8T3B9W3_DENNO|nr:hypothetical protein KFK09_010439 [Dendrobium nobile]
MMASAPAMVIIHILFIWGVYITVIREAYYDKRNVFSAHKLDVLVLPLSVGLLVSPPDSPDSCSCGNSDDSVEVEILPVSNFVLGMDEWNNRPLTNCTWMDVVELKNCHLNLYQRGALDMYSTYHNELNLEEEHSSSLKGTAKPETTKPKPRNPNQPKSQGTKEACTPKVKHAQNTTYS